MPLCKVLVLASLLAIVASITASRLPSNFQQQQRQRLTSARTVKDTTTAADNSTSTGPSLLYQQCSSQYAAFLPGIHKDLLLWAPTGIDAALMDKAFTSRTYYGGRAGIPLVVHQGALYVVGNRSAEGVLPWHRQELLEYVVVLRHLLSKHGTSIPDVDLVLLTNDEPEDLLTGQQPRTTPPLPYFRYCKSEDHPDITIPCWHLYEHKYSATYLSTMQQRQDAHPWASRRQQLFNRPGGYHRHVTHALTQKLNYTGEPTAFPRQAFADWAAAANSSLLNVTQGNVPLVDWAGWRWLAHVDGISCSCRLEKLLSLGSLLLKEESGYRSFYHHLLQPMVHYLPFWRRLPQEALEGIAWAAANDGAAQAMAAAAQALVARYLNKAALECFWVMLLTEYSRLLRYQPGGSNRTYPHALVPIDQWLETEQREFARLNMGHRFTLATTQLELEDPPPPPPPAAAAAGTCGTAGATAAACVAPGAGPATPAAAGEVSVPST